MSRGKPLCVAPHPAGQGVTWENLAEMKTRGDPPGGSLPLPITPAIPSRLRAGRSSPRRRSPFPPAPALRRRLLTCRRLLSRVPPAMSFRTVRAG